MSPIKPISLIETFFNEIYLDEAQNAEFKRTITNIIQNFKELKEEVNNISLNAKRITVNARVVSKLKFNMEIEKLKRTQVKWRWN